MHRFYALLTIFLLFFINQLPIYSQPALEPLNVKKPGTNCLDFKDNDLLPEASKRVCLSIKQNFISRRYYLGPKDVFSISVLDSPEFNQKNILIPPDGTVVIPPLGAINVAGMTIDELNNLIIEKLKFYLNDPKISIKLDKTKPFIVYVAGAVLKPGSYELNTDSNEELTAKEVILERKTPLLSNILVAAGGVSYDADLENVIITNEFDNTEIRVNLLELIENGDSKQDIFLISGDRVHIPKLPTAFAVDDEKYKKYMSSTISPNEVPVKVLGYVNNPGLIMLDTKQSLTLNSAIASAGGYFRNAKYPPKAIYLSRVDGQGRMVTKAYDPRVSDVVLRPKDIVYVPEKKRPIVGRFFDYTTRVITPFNTFASSYNNWALMFHPKRHGYFIGN